MAVPSSDASVRLAEVAEDSPGAVEIGRVGGAEKSDPTLRDPTERLGRAAGSNGPETVSARDAGIAPAMLEEKTAAKDMIGSPNLIPCKTVYFGARAR
jgi:hypothetical protein